jgi:hypothetical protein
LPELIQLRKRFPLFQVTTILCDEWKVIKNVKQKYLDYTSLESAHAFQCIEQIDYDEIPCLMSMFFEGLPENSLQNI